MSWLRELWKRVRSITKRQLAFGVFAVALGFAVLMGVLYTWDYTNSPQFCGTTCHTMPPEYNAWQRSPHARVSCVECHLGRDFITTTFTRKAGDLMHVVRYSSGNFTFPLYATTMIPAREACEKCHWPEKFQEDRSVAIKHFTADQNNSLVTTYLLLKTGGGTQREGLGIGIHWHIENQVDFISTDELQQGIPWVKVTDTSGKQTIYTDVENPLTPDEIAKASKQRIDCITCHNRISHTFTSPDQAVDSALALQRIDSTIPFFKQKAVEILSASYKTFDEANKSIEGLDAVYARDYPDYYRSHTNQIKFAIDFLKTTYQSIVFPTQDLSWTTHPDNIGHKDSPGCFRCHDGKHFTADNKQSIRLECNVCHTLPEVGKAGGPAPVISMTKADEPDSHKTTTWIAEHRTAFNSSCQACHDTSNAGGNDNSSFCSNSACHGTQWRFVGLDAPGLAKIFPAPALPKGDPNATPPQIPHPIGGSPDCQLCHAQSSKVRPYPADHVGRKNEVCLACHKPTIPPTAATPVPGAPAAQPAGGPPPIPHDTAGRTQCLGCHGNSAAGVSQIPPFHKDYGFTNGNCLTCHKSSVVVPAATPVAKPTAAAPAAGGPPRIPASHVGRTGCLQCHVQGLAGAPKYPANHAGRTEDTCKSCHPGP